MKIPRHRSPDRMGFMLENDGWFLMGDLGGGFKYFLFFTPI